MARRIISWGFSGIFVGEGAAESRITRCRHRSPRVVQCRMTGRYGPPGPRFEHLAAAVIRRDGVLVYRGRDLVDGGHWAIVTLF